MADARNPFRRPGGTERNYVLICLGLGVLLGIIFDKLALGIIFGLAVGIILANRDRPGRGR